MRRSRPVLGDQLQLLATAGGADFAAMTGFLLQAAARRTPVVLDGVVSGACALVAQRVTFRAADWWLAGHRSSEPAHALALTRLSLEPLLDLGMRLGEGTGALLAVPMVKAAAATLAEMATFDEAGVSDREHSDSTTTDTEESDNDDAGTEATDNVQQTQHRTVVLSGLRLAISLLSVVPVRRRDDGPEPLSAARRAMLWAPLVGAAARRDRRGRHGPGHPGRPALVARGHCSGSAAVAALTRGLHLDGLADTADGLGTRLLPPDEALAVMRRGDTGPFGVVSVVLVLLVQVSAAAQAGPLALMAAVVVGRLAMTWSCRRGVPAARPDGLGALVAGSVSPVHAAALALITLLAAVSMGPNGALGVIAGLAAGEVLATSLHAPVWRRYR